MCEFYICKKCNGEGETPTYSTLVDVKTNIPRVKTKFCVYCMGKGKLDWIEHIKGRAEHGNDLFSHWSTKWI